jgi:hypothetical protein
MSEQIKKPKPDLQQESLADAHLDIGLGNTYRLEYIKHLVSIATGVFVFSVTFMKDLVGRSTSDAHLKAALLIGWIALIASIVAGVLHMRIWGQYYMSWGLHYEKEHAKKWRVKLNNRRKLAEYLQIWAFVVGLVALVAFATSNLYPIP